MHKTHGNRIFTAYFSIRSPGFPFITKMNIWSGACTDKWMNPKYYLKGNEVLGDPRFEGLSKFAQYFTTSKGNIEIHYVGNIVAGFFTDFKFKN